MINQALQSSNSEDRIKHIVALFFFCFVPSAVLVATMLFAHYALELIGTTSLYLEVFFQQTMPMFLSFGIIPALFYNKYLKGSNKKIFNLSIKKSLSTAISFLLLSGFVIFLLINLESSMLVAPFIFHFIIVAITEEFVMRGLITKQLVHIFNDEWLALVLSALIFAFVFHSARDIASNLLFRFPLGFSLSLVYKKTKSLELPIILHWLYNSVISVLEIVLS